MKRSNTFNRNSGELNALLLMHAQLRVSSLGMGFVCLSESGYCDYFLFDFSLSSFNCVQQVLIYIQADKLTLVTQPPNERKLPQKSVKSCATL